MQFDCGGASKKCRAIAVLAQLGPGRGHPRAGKDAERPPEEIAPLAGAFAALDHDAERDGLQRGYDVQLTASRCRIGRPVMRFCGFMRMVLSPVMARIR